MMNLSASHDSPALGPSPEPPSAGVAIERAVDALFQLQDPAGYWWAELQSNVTITAEVLLLHHVWGTFDRVPRAGAERYFRGEQRGHGGWELAYGDGGELSVSIEAYLALRMLGVPPDDPALRRARAFILMDGGITKSRIFTKMHLALIGAYEWAGLPALPPWLMVLPERGPFSIYDLSSWARGSTVPLILLFDRKPVYGPVLNLDELYAEGRANARFALPRGNGVFERFFGGVDTVLKWSERAGLVPFRERGLRLAESWTVERQEHTGDWAGIIPAMLNAMLGLRAIGYDVHDPVVVRGFAAIDGFTITANGAYRVQPCISPVWDTGLAVRALADAGVPPDDPRLVSAVSWLLDKQIVARYGDWSVKNRTGDPGGWAFEFENAWYPDVDDTAVVAMALAAVDHPEAERVRGAIARAARWVATMQCKTGGWGAFDVDNDKDWLNRIPYGDLKAMIDPSTADVTARVLEMTARCGLGDTAGFDGVRFERGLAFLLNEQERDGAWFGRWGVNYVYGTSGALAALARLAVPPSSSQRWAGMRRSIDAAVVRGAVWLKSVQQPGGGWGETTDSYDDATLRGIGPPTASQTAWALIGLLACAERLPRIAHAFEPAIERGVEFLLRTQRADGTWDEPQFTGTGFPGHFYLNYHQYRLHVPLTALGRYAALRGRTPLVD
jgi:squalene-hopene/tetraprenyl-beta-curcumene cyclase